MKSIGVRELRQRASQYLRLVQSGESIEVTDRGRPVALLVPIPDQDPLDRLSRAGRLQPADGDVLEIGSPLPARPGVALPSAMLAAGREGER